MKKIIYTLIGCWLLIIAMLLIAGCNIDDIIIFAISLPIISTVVFYAMKFLNQVKKNNQDKANTFLKEHNASYVLKNIEYKSGISNFIKSEKCNIFVQNNQLLICNLASKNSAIIKYTKILACGVFDNKQIERNIVTKNGNVIGRGVLGGFFLGPVGAVLGGMSGLNNKTSTMVNEEHTYYFIINYKSNSTDQIGTIIFSSPFKRNDLNYLSNLIKNKIVEKSIEL